jgi:uncharacterized Fe-S cluster protein YjdI
VYSKQSAQRNRAVQPLDGSARGCDESEYPRDKEDSCAMAIEVTYDRKLCIHSGNCVKTLPQVFKVENGKFVIDTSAAEESKIRATVAACPSHALKI